MSQKTHFNEHDITKLVDIAITKFQAQVSKNAAETLTRIFKFLQLLSEDHYVPMKHFLRVQKNEIGNPSRRTKNLILYGLIIFKQLVEIINVNTLWLAKNLLLFLEESVQNPCEQNQKDLVENGLIENILILFKTFTSEENYKIKGIKTEAQKEKLEMII